MAFSSTNPGGRAVTNYKKEFSGINSFSLILIKKKFNLLNLINFSIQLAK